MGDITTLAPFADTGRVTRAPVVFSGMGTSTGRLMLAHSPLGALGATVGNLTGPTWSSGNSRYLQSILLSPGAVATTGPVLSAEVHDCLGGIRSLSAIVTTPQAVNFDATDVSLTADGRVDTSRLNEIEWWLSTNSNTGTTATTVNVAVTYGDNSTGTIAVSWIASFPAAMIVPILPAAGSEHLGIKSIQNITFAATTGTAGNVAVFASRFLTSFTGRTPFIPESVDVLRLGAPKLPSGAYIMTFGWAHANASLNLNGSRYYYVDG